MLSALCVSFKLTFEQFHCNLGLKSLSLLMFQKCARPHFGIPDRLGVFYVICNNWEATKFC